jgi:hypothetical protein
MPKLLKKPRQKIAAEVEPRQVEIDYVKQRIAGEINRRFSMSVAEFSRSDECDKLGIDSKNLQVYLSSGATSFPALSKAYEALGLGKLVRQEIRTVIYFEK